MSLTKKDPSLRVAANDPHLVSLGGGRLSVAVTIHYIPIGDTTIGSSPHCSITLNGGGVRATHCTIYRSEENEVTLVPERDARTLIDGTKITQEANLMQGAMITIGNSNYLRFNNPAEAELMRSTMGSNERISMPQIDFTQVPQRNSTKSISSSGDVRQSIEFERFYETTINPLANPRETAAALKSTSHAYNNMAPIDINGLQCPKVFTADLVTVNMPAKDVLGQKYASFAKNLVENHRSDKNVNNALRNNQTNNMKGNNQNGVNNYVNIPSTSSFIQNTTANTSATANTEYMTKVNNTSSSALKHNPHAINATAYDRYPKPGSYGGMQIFPMNGVNTEINAGCANASQQQLQQSSYEQATTSSHVRSQFAEQPHMNSCENECLEDMLKKCTEYADRQNQSGNSITSSPIVQNRIKTNGSLPRDKKSPFYHELSGSLSGSSGNLASKPHNAFVSASSGYENVRLVAQNRVEINGQLQAASNSNSASPKTGYENVVLGKYVPQSPRTKIRTTCMSPKKEHSFGSTFAQLSTLQAPQPRVPPPPNPKPSKQHEYDQLIRTFEEKLKLEMQAIEESSRYQAAAMPSAASAQHSPAKRANKNINNLTLNLQQSNSPRLSKKPTPAPRNLSKTGISASANSLQRIAAALQEAVARDALPNAAKLDEHADLDQLKRTRKQLLLRLQSLKSDISELRKQEDEVLRELDLEKALVCAELNSVDDVVSQLQQELYVLQHKIHRLEAQRNATRVMEENQQAKLKQSIEMKQDQVKKLKAMLRDKPNNDCLKEELHNVCESLENDRKTFEDLEFQYLEEESEWHAYYEELHAEEKGLLLKIEEKQLEFQHLQKQELTNQTNACSDTKTLKNNLIALLNEFRSCEQRLKSIEHSICDISGELRISSCSSDEYEHASAVSPPLPVQSNLGSGVMSQSLFGSAELLCPKRSAEHIMSKSVNENMFYNNKIELPCAGVSAAHAPMTSTPKRPQLKLVDIDDADLLDASGPPLKCTPSEDQVYNVLGNKCTSAGTDQAKAEKERIKFNLSLGNDDFEVNPLEKRVPSQDDIDRISKVTLDAPISTKGASNKIFDSIKEIERNRQLLLAQQGHHVIEHERQKMHDLKKKCHDEARAQYISMLNGGAVCSSKSSVNSNDSTKPAQSKEMHSLDEESVRLTGSKENQANAHRKHTAEKQPETAAESSSQQRHSQPEFETHTAQRPHSHSSPRPLSEANSELSCDDLLSEHNACKSSIELSNPASGDNRYSAEQQNLSGDDMATKRSSVNSNETTSGGSAAGGSERKRALPKHQRPLTRYLPIFSPDLNLRHHIESAGHQIALCPHVFVDAYSCRGYLHKLGATFHGWARRWFVLDRQRNAFIYYADKAERKPRGGAYFSTIDEVYLDHLNASKSGRPHCTLIVKTKKRSYHLQAASDAAARIWIDAIITGAQGNLDY